MSMRKHGVSRKTFVTFELGSQRYALPSAAVDRITPMAEIERPPIAPDVLAGFLNLGDTTVPVIRLHTLFGLPELPIRLWTPLVIVRTATARYALLVEEVSQVLAVDDALVLPLPPGHVLNDSVDGMIKTEDAYVLVIAPDKLLLQQEAKVLSELQLLAEQRVHCLEGARP